MIRVLHFLRKLEMGGIQTWLVHLIRHLDPTEVRFDFAVEPGPEQTYEEEVRARGAAVIRCARRGEPLAFARSVRRVLGETRYDIIHSHEHYYSGYTLALAKACGVAVRLAHAHNDYRQAPGSHPAREIANTIFRGLVRGYATGGLAVSSFAACDLYGESWAADRRWKILPCGIDLTAFEGEVDAQAFRRELDLSAGTKVVCHVGRFVRQKNHSFVLDVFRSICDRRDDVRLLLIGEGKLLPEIKLKAQQLGIDGKVVFAGMRRDVPALLRAVAHVLLLPSYHEGGLPLVAMEAQAAGVPVLTSVHVPSEAELDAHSIRYMQLSAPAQAWSIAIEDLLQSARNPERALRQAKASRMSIQRNAADLLAYYRSQIASLRQTQSV